MRNFQTEFESKSKHRNKEAVQNLKFDSTCYKNLLKLGRITLDSLNFKTFRDST